MWDRLIVPCEALECDQDPPDLPAVGGYPDYVASKSVLFQPTQDHEKQYLTKIDYDCPGNDTIPDRLKSNFSFAFDLSAGNVQKITAFCEIDR